MSDYFFDSSALARRYLSEVGAVWVRGLVNPTAGHIVWIAEMTEVEIASALAARRVPAAHSMTRESKPSLLKSRCEASGRSGATRARACTWPR